MQNLEIQIILIMHSGIEFVKQRLSQCKILTFEQIEFSLHLVELSLVKCQAESRLGRSIITPWFVH